MHNIKTSGILLFRQVSIMCLVIYSTASHLKKDQPLPKTATEECILVKRSSEIFANNKITIQT
jgi:hypothetical protein